MYLKRSIGFFADAASVLGQLQALRTLHGGSSCDSVTAAAASQAKARNRPVFSTGRGVVASVSLLLALTTIASPQYIAVVRISGYMLVILLIITSCWRCKNQCCT